MVVNNCVQQEKWKEIGLDNLFTTIMLLNSLKIKTIIFPSFTRITIYYNLYRPYKGGGWRCIQALRSHFRNITSGLHFSSILQSRASAKFLFSYPQFLQNLLFPLFLDVIPPGIPPAPNFPCGFGPVVQ